MILKNIDDIEGTEREVSAENGNWVSKRMLLKEDNMGFSFHETTIFANTKTLIWYKHHLEAVYCIEGEGEVETDDGKIYPVKPGTMYALDKNDKHYLRAFDNNLKLICVFNPPLHGQEVHGKDGSYKLYR